MRRAELFGEGSVAGGRVYDGDEGFGDVELEVYIKYFLRLRLMSTIKAMFDGEVFRPSEHVGLAPNTPVTITFQPALPNSEKQNQADVFRVLSERYASGETDVADRHNEHQP